MKASSAWLAASGADFSAGFGRQGCAHLKHYTVDYCEWGDGPPLVLIPGLAGGLELLGPLAGLLARDFRVISYQLRGEGDCFAMRRPFGLSDLVEDLAEFLDWHGLEAPAIMGVSFGGLLALELATRYPTRLRQLVVQGVGANFERGLLQRIAGVVLSRYPLLADNPFINQFFNLLFGGRQQKGPLFEFVTNRCWQTDQSVMVHRLGLVEQFNIIDRLSQIRAPALVMAGDKDLMVSEQSLRALCEGIQDARGIRLRGCGHLAFVTKPARIAEEIGRFLAN